MKEAERLADSVNSWVSPYMQKQLFTHKMAIAEALQKARDEALEEAANFVKAENERILSKIKPTCDTLSSDHAVNQNLRTICVLLPEIETEILAMKGNKR